jgi:hypothetical protein
MIPATHLVNSSTPVSTVSSLATNNTANTGTAVQSGPYTKAQCKLVLFIFVNDIKSIFIFS